MRHPFDGLVTAPAHTHRRSWLKGLVGAFAGLFVWKQAGAELIKLPAPIGAPGAPVMIGPDGRVIVGNPNDPEPFDPRASTAVRGEEGAAVTAPGAEAGVV